METFTKMCDYLHSFFSNSYPKQIIGVPHKEGKVLLTDSMMALDGNKVDIAV
jgi:hypothetical protein